MKLSKVKHSLIYNDFLTLSGIPPEAFDDRLAIARRSNGSSTNTKSSIDNAAASPTTLNPQMSRNISCG
jgi:hypothetical protein